MRCIRSVKSLRAHEGSAMRVVALYTDVDREAPFVRHADNALRLPVKTTEVAAYLDHDQLLDALRKVSADAVWPGWGFVAESAEFAEGDFAHLHVQSEPPRNRPVRAGMGSR